MSDELLLEVPEVDTDLNATEIGDENPAEQPDAGVNEKPETTEEKPVPEQVDPNATGWKRFVPELQKLDPKMAGEIKGKLIALENIDKDLLPMGGIKGVMSFANELRQLGGKDQQIPAIIQDVRQERDFFRGLDDQFTKNPSEFANSLANASAMAFDKAAPAIISKYAETNPEGFTAMVAGAIYSDMQSQKVPLNFDKIQAFWSEIPDSSAKTKIGEAIEGLFSAFNRVEKFSQQQPRKIEDAKPEQKEGPSIEDRELAATRQSWVNADYQPSLNLFNAELAKTAGNRKFTDEQRNEILNKVSEEISGRFENNKKLSEDMLGFLRSGDRNGFLTRLSSERKSFMPGAVRRAFDDVMGAAPKPGPKPGVQQAKKPTQQEASLNQYPAGEIDWRRTDGAMYDRGEAYLKGKPDKVKLPK